jgi:DNA-binding beta-propeller fold protein YncE
MAVIAAMPADEPLHFLAANDDTVAPFPPNTVSVYDIGSDGTLTDAGRVSTGGNGMAGGYFGASRILIVPRGSEACLYVSNSQSESISGIDARTRKLAGAFHGSHGDNILATDGVGLAANDAYLYAAFSGSGNIGTFRMRPDCALEFVGDLHAQGLSGGAVEGMAIHGNLLVAAYGDGSIESFHISGGVPVSNGDAQFDAGAKADCASDAVDITRDGHFAIFGCGSTGSIVEVSDISSGRLTRTAAYPVGGAWNSSSVRLSPDERILYISNSSGGRVTAAFFDRATGKVRPGCVSPPLRGFYAKYDYIGAVATELATGSGGLLYVPELGTDNRSYLGLLRFTETANGCALTETSSSPVVGRPASVWLSIGVYPPRPF